MGRLYESSRAVNKGWRFTARTKFEMFQADQKISFFGIFAWPITFWANAMFCQQCYAGYFLSSFTAGVLPCGDIRFIIAKLGYRINKRVIQHEGTMASWRNAGLQLREQNKFSDRGLSSGISVEGGFPSHPRSNEGWQFTASYKWLVEPSLLLE